MSKSMVKLVVVALLLALLAACTTPVPPTQAPAQSTEAPQPPAASGGKLTVLCTPQEDWCVALTQAFQKETGIETNYVRLSSGESVARLRAGKDNPEFDVWFGGPMDGYEVAKNEGLIEPYASPNAAVIREDLKDKDGFWTGVYVGAMGFCSNKDILADLGIEAPTSWEALLDPKLKGQIAMAHPATSGTAFTAFWTVATLKNGNVDQAFEYFKQLHNNILQYTKTGSAPGTMAGRGEVAVAIVFSHDCVKFQKEGMTSLVASFPNEGTGYEVGGVGVVKGARNPDAAKKWVDWVLTAKVQELAATVKSFQLPTNPNAAIPPEAVKLDTIKLVNYDFIASAAAKKGITERFDAEIAPAPKE